MRMAFEVDKALVSSLVASQTGGGLVRALSEAVMNAVDGGASVCRIVLERDRFVVEDDGRGFGSLDEITRLFGVFGASHEAGDARYARFRTGRAALFNLAVVEWHTGRYRVAVDWVRDPGGYEVVEVSERVSGCRVVGRPYEPVGGAVAAQVATALRYLPIPLFVNGECVSSGVAAEAWDARCGDAVLRFAEGDLQVYNDGILVGAIPRSSYGCGGVLVTLCAVAVTMARSEVVAERCPVWARIEAFLRAASAQRVLARRRSVPDAAEAQAVVRAVMEGVASAQETWACRGLRDAHGRPRPFGALRTVSQVCVARGEDVRFDVAEREMGALVLSADWMEKLGVPLRTVVSALCGRLGPKVVEIGALMAGLDGRCSVVADDALDAEERCVLVAGRRVMQGLETWLELLGEHGLVAPGGAPRRLVAGCGGPRTAWTDGSTFVALERRLLRELVAGTRSFQFGLMVMAHELGHVGGDGDVHEHDAAFLQSFHETVLAEIPRETIQRAFLGASRDVARVFLRSQDVFALADLWADEALRLMRRRGLVAAGALERRRGHGGAALAAVLAGRSGGGAEVFGELWFRGAIEAALRRYHLRHWTIDLAVGRGGAQEIRLQRKAEGGGARTAGHRVAWWDCGAVAARVVVRRVLSSERQIEVSAQKVVADVVRLCLREEALVAGCRFHDTAGGVFLAAWRPVSVSVEVLDLDVKDREVRFRVGGMFGARHPLYGRTGRSAEGRLWLCSGRVGRLEVSGTIVLGTGFDGWQVSLGRLRREVLGQLGLAVLAERVRGKRKGRGCP